MKSRWQQYKEKNGSTPLDLLNPKTKMANFEKSEMRMSLCLDCPELFKPSKQCKQCGCFMEIKTKIDSSKCPLGKW